MKTRKAHGHIPPTLYKYLYGVAAWFPFYQRTNGKLVPLLSCSIKCGGMRFYSLPQTVSWLSYISWKPAWATNCNNTQ